jgi:ubiquitin C-terminal hydrolase
LNIKGCNNIEEALDQFVKEEILEDDNTYYCEQYNKRIKASTKYLIKKLPRILMINLKRFEFNFITMQKQKLNDYCEFPFNLNLYKWSYDYIKGINKSTEEDYQYELVGVLVHCGTAESGHYYSFIKEREEKSVNYGKWFEFNDTRVSPFNVDKLSEEAYGISTGHSRSGNAYFLVYQKVEDRKVEETNRNDRFIKLIEEENENHINACIVLFLLSVSIWIVNMRSSLKNTSRLSKLII